MKKINLMNFNRNFLLKGGEFEWLIKFLINVYLVELVLHNVLWSVLHNVMRDMLLILINVFLVVLVLEFAQLVHLRKNKMYEIQKRNVTNLLCFFFALVGALDYTKELKSGSKFDNNQFYCHFFTMLTHYQLYG
jgi:heme/copper-type cytochrome/quinol oxidase subunit 3